MKTDKNVNRVIDLLNQELQQLEEAIKIKKGSSPDDIELKSQMITAIKNLHFCDEHGLHAGNIEVIRIPEGGSDAYFTEYIIVDEKEINNIPASSVVRENDQEIHLNCFDLILRKRK